LKKSLGTGFNSTEDVAVHNPQRFCQTITKWSLGIVQTREILNYLERLGIMAKTYEHAPVHTVDESRELRGNIPGIHTKNLFLRDSKKNFFLVVTDEATQINLKALGPRIGAKGGLSFGSPDALMQNLGVTPGSVSLLAAVNDSEKRVTVVLDESLLKAPLVNCHPLSNQFTTSLSPEGVSAFLSATAHTPLQISFADS
jgi:Ala-tRNA(Pro) deacylase